MRKNVENEDLRPQLTHHQWRELQEIFRTRYKSDKLTEYGHAKVWFDSVLDMVWRLGYEVRLRK